MKNIFSFCIYGTNLKYYYGLEDNICTINKYYPEYFIYIYCGKTRLDDYIDSLIKKYDNIVLFDTNQEGVINMLYRYRPITYDESLYCIIRDADSELNERDRWCINDFIKNGDETIICQVIRDHYWHKSRITGGLSFFKLYDCEIVAYMQSKFRELFIQYDLIENHADFTYGSDESVLNEIIHPIIQKNTIIYSNISVFQNEKHKFIDFINDGINFCGNVIEYTDAKNKIYKFNYFDYNLLDQLNVLSLNDQYDVMLKTISEYEENREISYEDYNKVLDYKYIVYFYKKNLYECMNIYKQYYKYNITDHIKNNSKYLYNLARELGYKIIGTCDVNIEPKENEFIIYFGNYPDDYLAYPQSNKIYKHIIYKDDIELDEFITHPCWNKIDKIYLMSLENEFERVNETILQLSYMNAPLNKIHVYRAKKDISLNDNYIGATKNHLDCIEMMLELCKNNAKTNQSTTCLFLEDDFIFTSNIAKNQSQLMEFFNRTYDYNICFLSASKYHKREDLDDLLILSKQSCTTSSGYLLNEKTCKTVYDTIKEGYQLLIENPEKSHLYCIDRYWTKLQNNNKVYIFKDKIGFQKPSKSKITGKLNIELD